ncbi:MAG: sigma-70 family RNA polymerase sigma factor [Myxococcales bacterium]|nr:sigma-70 family RNA polymerase sigma factor [Myxococcales bacterium]
MSELQLLAVIRGDPHAVRAFIHEFGPLFRSVIRGRVYGALLTREEDLLQELLFGLFRKNCRVLRLWDPNKGKSLRSFLHQFALQRTLDWLRQQRRHSLEVPSLDPHGDERADPTELAASREPPEWVAEVLKRFRSEGSPEDLLLIEMSYLQDCTVAEIAAALKLSEEAVYQRRHRIKQRLLKLKKELSG